MSFFNLIERLFFAATILAFWTFWLVLIGALVGYFFGRIIQVIVFIFLQLTSQKVPNQLFTVNWIVYSLMLLFMFMGFIVGIKIAIQTIRNSGF